MAPPSNRAGVLKLRPAIKKVPYGKFEKPGATGGSTGSKNLGSRRMESAQRPSTCAFCFENGVRAPRSLAGNGASVGTPCTHGAQRVPRGAQVGEAGLAA